MSVTTETVSKAFKTVYGPWVTQQVNVGLAAVAQKIESTTSDIQTTGSVVKPVPYGLNGGVGSITETGALPTSGANNVENFTTTLKTLAGSLEISDKAWKSSMSSEAAFENLLTSNIQGLKDAVKFSAGRQYYMDGTGELTACGTTTASLTVVVASTQYLIEGMIIDILVKSTGVAITNGTQRRIKSVNRTAKTITLEGSAVVTTSSSHSVYEQGSKDLEMTGFGTVFASSGNLYGLSKSDYNWLVPQQFSTVGDLNSSKFIKSMRQVRNYSGGEVDYIACADDVYEEYFRYLELQQRQFNTTVLQGGFKSLEVNGVPLVQDRFISSGTAYGLTTKEWHLHQLNDWEWMQDDKTGAILRPVDGYPKYRAALIKYADLICDHPGAQFIMTGITINED